MISYKNIYNYNGVNSDGPLGDIHRFRRVGRTGFDVTDNPDQRYFKILFYFYNDDVDTGKWEYFNSGSSGLLTPTWLDNVTGDYYKYNSAWAYLKNNYEEERADALKEFITLLSQISSESPWYFKSITGVDEAMTREKWVVGDERKKISISCLSDPVDRRIETLLSLYRSIVWSHSRKCEVLPANLRKFDMGLFIFSNMINGITHTKKRITPDITDPKQRDMIMRGETLDEYEWKTIGDDSGEKNQNYSVYSKNASYKYIEFHNCEISMDSIKSGYGEMSNEEGFEQTFTIDIYFDDCYENEFNPFVMKFFGDFFIWDSWTNNGINDNGDVQGNVPIFKEYVGKENSTDTSTESKNAILENLTVRANNVKNQAINALNGSIDSIKNSAINAITGGIGNIFGTGGGINGVFDSIEQETANQIKSISNKITGNINDATTKISKSLVNTVTKPVLGAIKASGTVADTVIDAAQNAIVKPVLGATKTVETASERVTETGLSYVNEMGNYVTNESKRLGDIAYSTQVGLANQIGKNRLNAKLGKL